MTETRQTCRFRDTASVSILTPKRRQRERGGVAKSVCLGRLSHYLLLFILSRCWWVVPSVSEGADIYEQSTSRGTR